MAYAGCLGQLASPVLNSATNFTRSGSPTLGGPLRVRATSLISGYNMTDDCIYMERLEELQEANARLQFLVSELLLKNQELRIQLAAKVDSLQKLHPL